MEDALSDVLVSMRLKGAVYFCDQLEDSWEKTFDDPVAASFHQVRRGGCWLQVSQKREYLGPGDLVFLGAGVKHVLSSSIDAEDRAGDLPPTLLLCGYCQFNVDAQSPLQALFPSMSILRQVDIDQNLWLKSSLDQLAAEYLSAKPGALVVVQRLTEILIVELIRNNFGRQQDTGFVRALNDPKLGQALQRLHANPELSWTLESLAQAIGMSRASFARRFKELVGQPMFEYLSHLRMQRAKELLSNTSSPLYEVATRVGYDSDVSFTKAFKRWVGLTPTSYRKQSMSE